MEPILYCACYDHPCSNIPTNHPLVALWDQLLEEVVGMVLRRLVQRRRLLRGPVQDAPVRRLTGLNFHPWGVHPWLVPQWPTLPHWLLRQTPTQLTKCWLFSG